MPQTLHCPRNHVVAFTDDDRGGEVYCPVCSVACPVPAAEGSPAEEPPADPAALRCRNGHVVPFTDDDRGSELYCPSCGVSCLVPGERAVEAEPPPPARPHRGKVKVFAEGGEEQTAATHAGQTKCPRCEQPIPYTVAEYGETVYCPRCGAAATVGQTLQQVVAEREPPPPENTALTPTRDPGRRFPVRWVAALVVAAGAFLAPAAYVSWQHPELLPFDANVLPWNKPLIADGGSATAPPPDKPAPASAEQPKPARPDEAITLEMIQQLSTRQDVQVALEDAQQWQLELTGYDVPATDPRLALLVKLIPELRKKVQQRRPAPPRLRSPAEQCLDWLDKMREAIKQKQLPAARAAAKEVEALLAAHPQDLAKYRTSYEQLQGWLKQLEQAGEQSVENVQKLLEAARARATPEGATEAMELRAKALFLVPRVRMTGDDKKKLTKLEDEVTRTILMARGRRAAADAEQCLDDGDDEALKRLVAEAKRILPEFTDQKDCLAAFRAVEGLAGKRAPRAAGSVFGRRVQFRLEYEAAMDAVRAAEPARGVAEAARAAERDPPAADRLKLNEFVFQTLDAAVARATELPADSPERKRWVDEARRALVAAEPWQGDERWAKLDAALRR